MKKTKMKKETLQVIPFDEKKKIIANEIEPFYSTSGKLKVRLFEWRDGMKSKEINESIWKNWKEPTDMFIISFEKKNWENEIKKKNEYYYRMNSKIPKFPLFIQNIFFITPILYYFLNGFSNELTESKQICDDFLTRIAKKLGVMISDTSFSIPRNQSYDKTGIHDFFPKESLLHENCVYKIESWMTERMKENSFGWLSMANEFAMDYIFEKYSIQKIAEFGIYLGKSTKYLLQKNPEMEYYGFDVFRPLFLTSYTPQEIKTVDKKFYYQFLRFETFHRNIHQYKHVTTIVGDIYENYNLLKKYNIPIEFVYIDFEKKTKPLIEFVEKVLHDYPNAIILGDDAVFPTVQKAVRELEKKGYGTVFLGSCYLCKKGKFDKDVEKLKEKVKEHYVNMREENMEKLRNLPKLYSLEKLKRMLEKKEDKEKIIKSIQFFEINPNEIYHGFYDMNVFHIIGLKYYDDKEYYMDIYRDLNKKYKDKNVKNSYGLIPYEYIQEDLRDSLI